MLVTMAAMLPLSLAFTIAFTVAAPDRDAMTAVALVGLLAFIVLIAAFGIVSQVLSLALYRFATDGGSVGSLTDDDLAHAIVPRRKLGLRRRRS